MPNERHKPRLAEGLPRQAGQPPGGAAPLASGVAQNEPGGHVSTNSIDEVIARTFMFHGVGFDLNQAVRLEEKNLRETLDSLLSDQILDRVDSVGTHQYE